MNTENTYEDGVNGLGEPFVNANSESFKVLQEKIIKESRDRDPFERIKDRLLGIRFEMEDFLHEEKSGKS